MSFKRFTFIICCVLLASCDVHEFPDPKPKEIPFVLNLEYDTEMPLHKVVEYTEDDITKSAGSFGQEHDVRYQINLYDASDESSREVLYSFRYTRDEVSSLDYSAELEVPEGRYRFVVWTDYVSEGTGSDMYYDTGKFEYVALAEGDHSGSNDMRDGFTGSGVFEVSETSSEATIDMKRPFAKFNFISTDLQDFILEAAKRMEPASVALSELSSYTVVFKYNGFMNSAYNLHTFKPTDACTGVTFNSSIRKLNESDAEMGFDYVFVNGSETKVSVSVEVYDADGERLSSFKPVDVPLVRSKLTTIRANFLTADTGGGVSVDPDYDGDFNIEIK